MYTQIGFDLCKNVGSLMCTLYDFTDFDYMHEARVEHFSRIFKNRNANVCFEMDVKDIDSTRVSPSGRFVHAFFMDLL